MPLLRASGPGLFSEAWGEDSLNTNSRSWECEGGALAWPWKDTLVCLATPPRRLLSPVGPQGVTALTSAFMVEELAEAQREGEAKTRKVQSSKTKAVSFDSVGSQQLLGFAGFW